MKAYVGLIRAVNVSGTGKLPKEELKAMGDACGFKNARTFINSGNLLFSSDEAESTVKQRLEDILAGRNPSDPFARKPEIGAQLRRALRDE